MKTIMINNVSFEIGKPITLLDIPTIKRISVTDVYGRPSLTKIAIYEDWERWFLDNDGYCGVASHSCNFFTIKGRVIDQTTNKEYYCYITASHNRAYEII